MTGVKTISPWKKALLGAMIAATFLVVLEVALWAAGVRPAWMDEDPYAGFSLHIPHFVSEVGGGGEATLTVAPSKREVLNPSRFTARKRSGSFRIVCVGDSTVYGRPFYDLTSFPGWLRALLPAMQPDRPWEVINAGAISYASYRVAGVMDELSRYEADLFIVYAGHNEFLERRTYAGLAETPSLLTSTASLANRTRMVTAIRGVFDRLGVDRLRPAHRATVLGENTRAIPINAVGPEAYHRDEAFRAGVRTHYRASLERMTRIARESNARLLFVVPASNLADFAPFKSEHREGLSSAQVVSFEQHWVTARQWVTAGRYTEALGEIEQAKAIDARYAALWYLEGRCQVGLGRHDLARIAYQRARDEDICPLRLPGDFSETLRTVARDQGIPVVDFEALAGAMSDQGLPGQRLFHDHVHPTVEANRALALAITTNLVQSGMLQPTSSWGAESLARVVSNVTHQVDRPLYAEQLRMLSTMLAWLGQPDPARFEARRSFEYSGQTAEAMLDLATRLRANGVVPLALEFVEEAARVAPESAPARYALALARIEAGRKTEAMEDLRAVVRLDPGLSEAQLSLAALTEADGDLAGAEAGFREVVQRFPKNSRAHALLGQNLARQKRFADAVGSFLRAAELEPGSGPAQYNLGLAYEKAGRWADARRHYLESLRLNPGQREVEMRLQGLDALERGQAGDRVAPAP